MEKFAIKSSSSDAKLIFSERKGDDFVVEFESIPLRVTRTVSGFMDPQGVAVLLKDIASSGRPWEGPRVWQSLEGEFSLSARCNSKGQVTLEAEFRRVGAAEEWAASATLTSELGLLPAIASAANDFFGVVP